MKCCTYPRAVLFVAALAAAAVCIWLLVPWEAAVHTVIPTFGRNSSDTDDSPDDGLPPLDVTSGSTYDFFQCEEEARSIGQCCNGLASNCNLRVDEIMFATLHNAMSTSDDKFFGPNHEYSLEKALRAGYRGLTLDLCDCDTSPVSVDLRFCHGVCIGGTRDVREVLSNIVEFMKYNREEVIIIDFEVNENERTDRLDALSLMMKNTTFDEILYIHPDTSTQWPVMRELVHNDTRIIVFIHNGPNCEEFECPSGFHNLNTYVSQTKFSFQSVEDVTDYNQSCRVETDPSNPKPFLLVNHFVTDKIAVKDAAAEINRDEFIQARMVECSENNGDIDINMFSLDFWSYSELPRITQEYNVKKAARREVLS